MSTEVRSLAKQGKAGLTCWAPNTNLFRDPRWGRGQEVFSEDAFHTTELVRLYVDKLQGPADEPRWVTAVCKHTYTYDMENADGVTRGNFDARVSARDLEEYYMQPFA